MSAVEPSEGEVFSVRIIKTLNANPAVRWANTYEMRAFGPATAAADLVLFSDHMVAYEKALTFSTASILYSTVSTYVPDSRPYTGEEFLRLDYNEGGGLPISIAEAEPLQVCLRVSFLALSGRAGFRLYRHALVEGDVISPAGSPAFADASILTSRLSAALTAGNVADHLIGGSAATQLVLASGTTVRPVGSIGLQGITVKKLNNKYFNRAP